MYVWLSMTFQMEAAIHRVQNSKLALNLKLCLLLQLVNCAKIQRPYSYGLNVTNDPRRGSERIKWSNYRDKFPDNVFYKLFRFQREQIPQLINCLKVKL